MNLRPRLAAFGVLAIIPFANSGLQGQTMADTELLAEINKIRAIDNHGHPKRALNEGETDPEMDFADPSEPDLDMPVRVRPSNPEFVAARTALYGPAGGNAEATPEELVAAQQRVR